MKTTDEIIETAERFAKNRAKYMKLTMPDKQRQISNMRTAYVEGYAQAIKDFKVDQYREVSDEN